MRLARITAAVMLAAIAIALITFVCVLEYFSAEGL